MWSVEGLIELMPVLFMLICMMWTWLYYSRLYDIESFVVAYRVSLAIYVITALCVVLPSGQPMSGTRVLWMVTAMVGCAQVIYYAYDAAALGKHPIRELQLILRNWHVEQPLRK